MKRRHVSLLASAAGVAILLAGCSSPGAPSNTAGTGSAPAATGSGCGVQPVQASDKVAVILQSTAASDRWETQDRPRLLRNISTFAPNAQVLYSNGEGQAANQLNQAEAAMAAGAKVLVVAPVDGVAAGEIARRAASNGVRFIAYDAPVKNGPVDYYVSFDNVQVGVLMGEFIRDSTKDGDTVAFVSGASQDDNAILFQQGALNVLQPLFNAGSRKLGFTTFTPNWDRDNAQREMGQALSQLGNNVQAVVAANDNLATGSINALQAAGLAGKIPVTGQDATAAGLGQIVSNTQGMTVYKPLEEEAKATAQLVACLLAGQNPPVGLINGAVDNGQAGGGVNGQVNNGGRDVGSQANSSAGKIPAVLLQPVKVTKDNIGDTVIKDKFLTWDEICRGVTAKCPPESQ